MSEWAKIEGFDYFVSSDGQVKNSKTGRILKQTISTSGYLFVQLFDGKKNMKYVHRLVAEAFIPNLDNLPQVDHIDGNKHNNNVSNLRWLSVRDNHYAYGFDKSRMSRRRAVIGEHLSGERIVFDSRKATAEHFKCHPAKIKYGYRYVKSEKQGWIFYKVEDIV